MSKNNARVGTAQSLFASGSGMSAESLQLFVNSGMQTGTLRPFIANDGRMYIVNTSRSGKPELVPVNHALLREDEWKALDETVIGVVRQTLNGVADLQNRGLTRPLGGLGVMVDEWDNIEDISEADVDMDAGTPGREDTVAWTRSGVPIPIIHKGYRLDLRRLLASRKMGASLDTTQADFAARKVRDKLESILFNGLPNFGSVDSYTIYGYTNFPYRDTYNIDNAWDGSSGDPVNDVIEMLKIADSNKFRGPFVLYVPMNYWSVLRDDYSSNYPNKTILDRILDFQEVEAVKPADVLNSSETVMVQMSRDVVDLAVGSDIQNIEWNAMGGLIAHYKVLAAMAPRLKWQYDDSGNQVCGIIHSFETASSTTTV
jgi:uncharacterized linocin/CFP29 family protein